MMERYRHLHRIILMVVLQGGFPGSYSQDRAITLPESIRVLRGSCVEIPCTFTDPMGFENSNLIWYKKSLSTYEIIFDQHYPSQINERYRGRTSLVGNEPNSCSLRINDVQESGTYYPYIYGNCDDITDCYTVSISVTDVPSRPAIQIPTDLTEGKRAPISCSVEHTCPPSPPTLQWNRAGYKLTDRQQSLKDGVWKAETVMEYLPSYRDHGAELECKATYPNGLRSQRRVTLNITFSPKNTRIVISDGKKERKEGDAVSLTCESDANPAANAFTWYNNKRDGTVELREEQGRSITVTVGRGRETFSCTARNPLGTENSTLSELQVLFSPKNTRVLIPDGKKERKEGDAVSLTCASDANPAANAFTWYNNKRDGTVELREEQGRSITVTVGRGRETFSCAARNIIGDGKSTVLGLQVLYKAKDVIIEGKDEVKEGAALELECHFSDYNPPTTQYSYSWYLNGNPVNGETGRILQINNITESHSGNYSCNVQNGAGPSSSPGFAVTLTSATTGEEQLTTVISGISIISGSVAGAVLIILLILALYLYLRYRKSQKGGASGGRRVEPDYQNSQPTESPYAALQMGDTAVYDVMKNPQATESPYAALQMGDTAVYDVMKNSHSTENPYAALQLRDAALYHDIKLKNSERLDINPK
ncbi:B-cell receptor CD22 [Xenopus tropicalis]|uniref:B-cell receptor CD22 n=1 Tax=Xenopus tropicalis TaxID=8364 RepID=A0A8J1JZ29_XENTR|nr:B-cell receptor CD22 [Xenopus tropicalis]